MTYAVSIPVLPPSVRVPPDPLFGCCQCSTSSTCPTKQVSRQVPPSTAKADKKESPCFLGVLGVLGEEQLFRPRGVTSLLWQSYFHICICYIGGDRQNSFRELGRGKLWVYGLRTIVGHSCWPASQPVLAWLECYWRKDAAVDNPRSRRPIRRRIHCYAGSSFVRLARPP